MFQFCRLPFGLTSSPQVFTDVTRPLMEECRLRGIRVIFYLNDILILAPSRAIVIRHRDTVLEILESAGFRCNLTKCRLEPSKTFPYLGLISRLAKGMIQSQGVRVLNVMGKMNFASMAVPLGRLHSRPLQMLISSKGRDFGSMNTKVQMSPEAVDSLRWWSSLPVKGRSLSHPLPNLVLATDASMKR